MIIKNNDNVLPFQKSNVHLFKPYRCAKCKLQISSNDYQYPTGVNQDKNYYKLQVVFNIEIEDKIVIQEKK